MSETKALVYQDLVTACHGVAPLPPEKQNTWNLMGQAKVAMDLALQKCALEIQAHLADFATMDQAALAKGIAAYKETYKKMVEVRQRYTTFLDGAKYICMETERVWDPKTNKVFLDAGARELNLRIEADKKAKETNAKATEEQMFRQFVVNEYADMLQSYKQNVYKIVHDTYTTCLTNKMPADKVNQAMTDIYTAIRQVRPRNMERFDRKIITDAEAIKLYESVTPPNWQNVFNDVVEFMKAKFKLYANDLANPEKAAEVQNDLFAQQQTEQQQQHEATLAANNLLASATIPIVTPAGMKPIVETTVIEIPTVLDWEWEARILAAFLANLPNCKGKVRTKKGGQLTTEQMAKALDAAGVLVEGIKYADLKK